MKDKSDYARKAITRVRSGVVIDYETGILFLAPNPSRALHKFSELYDRIAFAAAGRYNEFEQLRQAGVRYADLTGYQYDRRDVTARGLANWYAQLLGATFTERPKPLEVEIVVAEVGHTPEEDQIYRITFDGSVADEHGYVAMGGQAEEVATALAERYRPGLTLPAAIALAISALSVQNGAGQLTGAELEAAILDRTREHRMFRRLTGTRLESLLTEAAEIGSGDKPAVEGDKSPVGAKTPETADDRPAVEEPESGSTDPD